MFVPFLQCFGQHYESQNKLVYIFFSLVPALHVPNIFSAGQRSSRKPRSPLRFYVTIAKRGLMFDPVTPVSTSTPLLRKNALIIFVSYPTMQLQLLPCNRYHHGARSRQGHLDFDCNNLLLVIYFAVGLGPCELSTFRHQSLCDICSSHHA